MGSLTTPSSLLFFLGERGADLHVQKREVWCCSIDNPGGPPFRRNGLHHRPLATVTSCQVEGGSNCRGYKKPFPMMFFTISISVKVVCRGYFIPSFTIKFMLPNIRWKSNVSSTAQRFRCRFGFSVCLLTTCSEVQQKTGVRYFKDCGRAGK